MDGDIMSAVSTGRDDKTRVCMNLTRKAWEMKTQRGGKIKSQDYHWQSFSKSIRLLACMMPV